MKIKKTIIALVLGLVLVLSSCVDQRGPIGQEGLVQEEVTEDLVQDRIKNKSTDLRIVATSVAVVDIMDKLDLDLVGVCDSKLTKLPSRYQDLTRVGMAMSPDIEIIKSLDPDLVLSPVSLVYDLLAKYEAANIDYGFVNLNNLDGMYASIGDLGDLLDRKDQAQRLIDDYESFKKDLEDRYKDRPKPKVLILMGLPGSYLVATENSYAGSLVALLGAENVYSGTDEQFLNINPEDMVQKDIDIILRTAHAMPEDVMAMFKEEFETNDTWKHFKATKEGRIYDLDYDKFGMSARFNYQEAIKDLEEIIYGQ